jgi:hypothetical protein
MKLCRMRMLPLKTLLFRSVWNTRILLINKLSIDVLFFCSLSAISYIHKKYKAIPVTGRGGPQGCERSRLPHFLSQNQTKSYVTTDGQSANLSWYQAPIWGLRPDFYTVTQLRVCWCGAPSLTRERVCRLQLLLVLASAVILGSESRGTRDHILLSQIRDFPNLEGQVPVFISPRNRVAQLYPQALCSLFVASYDSHGYGGGIRTRLHARYIF